MRTGVAFELFRRAGVRIAVLEVGLGGRLDATNVVRPDGGGDHVDRARSPGAARRNAGGDRVEKAGIIGRDPGGRAAYREAERVIERSVVLPARADRCLQGGAGVERLTT